MLIKESGEDLAQSDRWPPPTRETSARLGSFFVFLIRELEEKCPEGSKSGEVLRSDVVLVLTLIWFQFFRPH